MRETVGGVVDQLASKESGENQGLDGWLKRARSCRWHHLPSITRDDAREMK